MDLDRARRDLVHAREPHGGDHAVERALAPVRLPDEARAPAEEGPLQLLVAVGGPGRRAPAAGRWARSTSSRGGVRRSCERGTPVAPGYRSPCANRPGEGSRRRYYGAVNGGVGVVDVHDIVEESNHASPRHRGSPLAPRGAPASRGAGSRRPRPPTAHSGRVGGEDVLDGSGAYRSVRRPTRPPRVTGPSAPPARPGQGDDRGGGITPP
jgi:hypothetical protein